jgi:glycerol-3-phosphate dehydrogenase
VAYLQSPGHQALATHRPARRWEAPNSGPGLLLRDFLQERWKGLTPILWGQQLQQERLDELIYLSVMGVDRLPGGDERGPMGDFYHDNPQPDEPLRQPDGDHA